MNENNTIKTVKLPEHSLPLGEPLLSVHEVAKALGCGRSTVWRWARCGIIARPLRILGISRWVAADVRAVILKAEQARQSVQPNNNDNRR